MASVTFIVPISHDVTDDAVEDIYSLYGYHHYARLIISRTQDQIFNLSKARNAGAKMAETEWLAFTDADFWYRSDLIQRMLDVGAPAIAGKTRIDVQTIDQAGRSDLVAARCGFAPLLIKKSLFVQVGGYCQQYHRWGYEDSDFEQKLTVVEFDSQAYHIQSIHDKISTGQHWQWGQETNRPLFDLRMKLTVEQRIAADVAVYNA